MLAHRGILEKKNGLDGSDVDCSTSEQVCGCVRQTLVCLEEIKHSHEKQTKLNF